MKFVLWVSMVLNITLVCALVNWKQSFVAGMFLESAMRVGGAAERHHRARGNAQREGGDEVGLRRGVVRGLGGGDALDGAIAEP